MLDGIKMDRGSGKQLETVLEEIHEENGSTPVPQQSENFINCNSDIKARSTKEKKRVNSSRFLKRPKESDRKNKEDTLRRKQISSSKKNTSVIRDKQTDSLPSDQQNGKAQQEEQNENMNGLQDMIDKKENNDANIVSELNCNNTENIESTTPDVNGDAHDSRMSRVLNEMTENNEEHYQKFKRQATEQSLLFSQLNNSAAMSYSGGRSSSARSLSFSRQELEYFLPKRNFFSSHDLVLRDAGYEVEDTAKARQRALWKAKLYAIRGKMDMNIAQDQEKSTNTVQPADSNQIINGQGVFFPRGDLPGFPITADQAPSQQEDRLPKTLTTVSAKKPQKFKKKTTDESDDVRVDHKPLVEYLKFIRENPEEYMSMVHFTSSSQDHQHSDRLVRTARAFCRGHNGPAKSMNVVHHALSQLKLKNVDPGPPPTANKEKSATGSSQEDDKTEIEKQKLKLDKWLKSINTIQLIKAKELALKDIGEEDINACWWISLQTCSYLRQPSVLSESAYF